MDRLDPRYHQDSDREGDPTDREDELDEENLMQVQVRGFTHP